MTSLELIIQDFKAFYNGSPWFGDSYLNIVSDITPTEALATPPNGHSIAVLLWHMVKWRKALTERLLGNTDFRAAVNDEDNWPASNAQTATTWEAAKATFAEQQTILIEQLSVRNEAFLDTDFLQERKYRHLVSGVLQHDIYHLGQVAMLKGLIRNHNLWKS